MSAKPEVAIIFKDDWFLVLHKPSGLPTTSPTSGSSTLVSAARALDPDAERLHPSSRLDAEVSGVVIFARSRAATEHLLGAREAGSYRRGYVALAPRAPEPATGEWSAAIAIDARDPRKRSAVAPSAAAAGAKPALTHYRTLTQLPLCALLWLEPRTGRTHQLRVHAANAGIPILGDRPYGGAIRIVRADGGVIPARRTMLHCARVSIPDPHGEDRRCFEAEPPEDMRALWSAAGGDGFPLPATWGVAADIGAPS